VAAGTTWWTRAQRYLDRDLWAREEASGTASALVRRALQVAVIVAQGVSKDHILLRASALTYFSALALIPLLALAFSLVGAFGVSQELAQLVVKQLAAVAPEAGERIIEVVQNVEFGSLGTIGASALFVTTVLALGNVERALNTIWGVEAERSLARRFPDYLAVLVVAPLLLGVAVSLRTTLQSQTLVQRLLEQPEFSAVYGAGLRLLSVGILWLAFALLYWFLPNTRVRVGPALLGGLVAAVLFSVAQELYVDLQIGVARANAVFGGLAALPVLLVWVYVSWSVVLLGAEFAFATQNLVTFRQARRGEEPRPAAREVIGLAVAARLARAFRDQGGLTPEELAEEFDVPVRSIRAILRELAEAGIVAPRGASEGELYQLGRAADAITAAEVLGALRGPAEFAAPPALVRVRGLVDELEAGARRALAARTLADLAGESTSVDPPGSTP
jgi:membrane protein